MDLKSTEEIVSKIDQLTAKVIEEKANFESSGNIDIASIEACFSEIFTQLNNQKITEQIKLKLEEFQKHFEVLGALLMKHRDVLSADVKSITSHETGLKAYTNNASLSGKNS